MSGAGNALIMRGDNDGQLIVEPVADGRLNIISNSGGVATLQMTMCLDSAAVITVRDYLNWWLGQRP